MTFICPNICFVAIPAGKFLMGGVGEDKFVTAVELPVHEVGLRAFELSLHPVTRRQWGVANSGEIGGADLPMTSVSFPEAEDFAKRMDARLPTEAEWEYACRAGSMNLFPTGLSLLPEDANFFYDEGGDPVGEGTLTPVGKHRPNAFGLYDMIGNVCEWTADLWHPNYQNAPCDGSAWIEGGQQGRRVIRGGAWDQLPRTLRASWRDWAPESTRWDNLGFRLARDLSSP